MNKINKELVLANPVLKRGFNSKLYNGLLSSFIEYANKGAEADKTSIIGYLLKRAFKYCGISKTYFTIYYDFAWAILEKTPEIWNDEEKENGFSDIGSHMNLFPEYDNKFDSYDVATLNYGEVLIGSLNILKEDETEHKDYFCYAIYVYFDYWKFQYNNEIRLEVKAEIEEEEENHDF